MITALAYMRLNSPTRDSFHRNKESKEDVEKNRKMLFLETKFVAPLDNNDLRMQYTLEF